MTKSVIVPIDLQMFGNMYLGGFKISSVYYDFYTNRMLFRIEDSAFPETPDGERPPTGYVLVHAEADETGYYWEIAQHIQIGTTIYEKPTI